MSDSRKVKRFTDEQSIKQLVRKNPGIDVQEVRRASALVQELRRTGFPTSQYRIESPYERRCAIQPET